MFRSALTALCLASLGGLAAADTPLQQALRKAEGPLYAFDLAIDDGAIKADLRIDPAQPAGKRVTVRSPAADAMTEPLKKRIARMEKNVDGDIWCTSFAENIPADAVLARETDTTLVYTFTPLPGADDKQFAGAFKFLKGEVVIDKADPAILSFQMIAPKPFKPMAVAKVEKFDMRATCVRGPDGRTHVATLQMKLDGTAMMQPLKQNERQKISNLAKVADTSSFGTR